MPIIENGWRAGGLLLHPTSLSTSYGIGDLGPAAHEMIVFLKRAGFHFWQTLPLTPTSEGLCNSPYSSYSAFAGNPLLVSPDFMARDGWLTRADLESARLPKDGPVDFVSARRLKDALIDQAFGRHAARLHGHTAFQEFCHSQGCWLNDFAFFIAAKDFFGGETWLNWPDPLRHRNGQALHNYGTELARPILREKFAQFLFFEQLREFRAALHEAGLGLIGDAAIYVNHDSSDVWAQPYMFLLDGEGRPELVAGVPPDYFSADGQLWGNPIFNWAKHREHGYNWWDGRLRQMLNCFDWVRLDHFRAFAAYWAVPADAPTAASGHWAPGPGADLFECVSHGTRLDIIAEDLGVITPDVTELRRRFHYPGMRVLQFAFGEGIGRNSHAPFRIESDNVVYAATHDNNTTRGWFRRDISELERRQLSAICGFAVTEENVAWALIRLAWLSPGALAVCTMQDVLNLDERGRMNLPGTAGGNWAWRLNGHEDFSGALADRLAELAELSGRDNLEHPNTLRY